MRTQQLLNIMESFLDVLKYEQVCEAFGGEDPIDFMCDDSDDWEDEEHWEEWEEEREEITETVKDNSPDALKDRIEFLERTLDTTREDRRFYWENYERVQEENEHLRDLINMLCDTFGLDKYYTGWKLAVSWENWLIEEIAKARKKLRK